MAAFATFFMTSSLVLLIVAEIGESGSVGINYGRQASQKLLPSMVVDMCLANGISKVKTFSVNEGVMSAFSGSNIELIVAIPNVELILLTNKEKAKAWMEKYILEYRTKRNVNIRYLCVGVEPFSKIERDSLDDTSFTRDVVTILGYMKSVIENNENLKANVSLGVPLAANLLGNASKPSEADFSQEFKSDTLGILKVLDEMNAPFMINIYPYLHVTKNSLPLEFGLFDNRSNYSVNDDGLIYTNAFDVQYDSLVWALRKNGYGHIKIMVTQVGWPTDGGPGATVANAKRFYDGLFKKVAMNQGTPLVPEADLDVYLYVLSDENQRRIDRGPFERHYGIYKSDGTPKFNLDFTLQGRDFVLESAKGVTYLPQRWCVLNKTAAHDKPELVGINFNKTWMQSDITAVNGSCSSLDYYDKVSYAFNSYFQMSNQEVVGGDTACDFNGLGVVVTDKPKFEGCDFPVQILSTIFFNGTSTSEMSATLGLDSAGECLQLSYPLIIIVPLLWIFGI